MQPTAQFRVHGQPVREELDRDGGRLQQGWRQLHAGTDASTEPTAGDFLHMHGQFIEILEETS